MLRADAGKRKTFVSSYGVCNRPLSVLVAAGCGVTDILAMAKVLSMLRLFHAFGPLI